MSRAHAQIQDYLKLQPEFHQNSEPFHNADKQFILNENKTLNNQKLRNENLRTILVKLIYLLNIGVHFNEWEVEQFFQNNKFALIEQFKIKSDDQQINKDEQIYYYWMIMPLKYIHILLQRLTKDLMSDDPIIKLQALKFIPFMQDEQKICS